MISPWWPDSSPQTGTSRTIVKPGVRVGTMIWVMLLFSSPFVSSVRHITMAKSARLAFETIHL